MAKRWFNRRVGARVLTGLLCFAMLAPMAPSRAALEAPTEPVDTAPENISLELSTPAFNSILFANDPWPVKMHVNKDAAGKPDGTGEAPTITVEVNGVLDQSNNLTGFVEVALRIKPGVLYYKEGANPGDPRILLDGKEAADAAIAAGETVITELQPFSTQSVALIYSGKLTPWEWDKLDGNWQKKDSATDPATAVEMSTAYDKGFSESGMVEVPALHKKTRIAQVKVSAYSDAGPKGNNDGVTGNDGGCLFLMAEGFTADDFNAEDTVTVVARFKYTLDSTDDNKNPWSTAFPKGAANPNATDWIDSTKADVLVRYATQEEIDYATTSTGANADPVTDPVIDHPVLNVSGKSEAYPHGNVHYWSDDTTVGIGAYDPTKPTTDPDFYSIDHNRLEDPVPPTPGDTTAVVMGRINTTLVNKLSYNASYGDPNDFTTILYYDWDNTLLGTQIVPRHADVRGLVNDYVAENFIYHDKDDTTLNLDYDLNDPAARAAALGGGKTAEDVVKSLTRADNYRGKYPADGVYVDNTTNDTTVDDKSNLPKGAEYPLTNKLDYVFFKRPMVHVGGVAYAQPDPNEQVDDGFGNLSPKYPGGATDPAYQSDLAKWQSYPTTRPDPTEETAPGTPKYPGGDQDPQYLIDLEAWNSSPWIQKATVTGATVEPDYDVDYPYAYGWAECTVSNYQDVWTTLGTVGELSDYNGAMDGGYMELNGAPARVSCAGTSQNRMVFADLSQGFDRGTVVLKAVYEPGKDLMKNGFLYRQTKAPYYNKLNDRPANTGGAYSVELVFERASTEEDFDYAPGKNYLRGVARLREPYVRQDTTPDLLWEENEALDISHNLPSATYSEAYDSKEKNTYTKVEVANKDLITFTLTLSARQNKVDYYFKEAYQSSFVGGAERSLNDKNRSEAMAIQDNYNYYVDAPAPDGSNITDNWYDASYETRDGSRGFVLSGTLNQIMELASKNDPDFEGYTGGNVFRDMNLRQTDGSFASTGSQLGALRTKVLAAAAAARAAHSIGDDSYWDTEHDCARLTYHQLQGFIINGSLNHPETAVSGLGWCHLHKACADANAGIPTDWPSLMKAAYNGFMDGTKDISFSILADLDKIARLRKDNDGAALTLTEYHDKLKTAVQALATSDADAQTLTWDQVQTYIIDGAAGNAADAPDKYWWYDGEDVTFNNWSDLLKAAAEAYEATDNILAPGEAAGAATIRAAKLNQLEKIFNDNAALAPAAVHDDWKKATENLCITMGGIEGQKFATFAAFRTALVDALVRARGAGVVDGDGKVNADWYQVQYDILHNGDAGYNFPPSTPTPALQAEYDTYWWHNGGIKVQDLVTLFKAARAHLNGDSTAWNAFTFADFCRFDTSVTPAVPVYPQLHFRKGFNGTTDVYTAADFANFKSAVLSYMQNSNGIVADETTSTGDLAICWNELQYYLIHPGFDFSAMGSMQALNKETPYYWWRDGKDGEVYTLSKGNTDNDVKTLMEAAYRHAVNGNPKAYDQLDAAAAADYRLIPSYAGTEADWNALTKYTAADLQNLKNDLDALASDSNVTFANHQDVHWRQIQHFILTGGATSGTYLPLTDTNLPSDSSADAAGYWWREGTNNPASGPVTTDMDKVNEILDKWCAGDTSLGATSTARDNAVKALVDDYFGATKMNIFGGTWSSPKAPAALTAGNISTLKTKILNLAKNLKNKQGVDGTTTHAGDFVDWYVLQYYVLNTITQTNPNTGAMKTKAECKTLVEGKGVFAPPAWVTGSAEGDPTPAPEESYWELELARLYEEQEAQYAEMEELRKALPQATEEEKHLYRTQLHLLREKLAETQALIDQILQKLEEELGEAPLPTQPPEVTESPKPTESPEVTESPKPVESPDPTESPEPSESPAPSESPEPSESPKPSESPEPETPEEPEEPTDPEPSESPTAPTDPDDPVGADPSVRPDPTDPDDGSDKTETPTDPDDTGGSGDPPLQEQGDVDETDVGAGAHTGPAETPTDPVDGPGETEPPTDPDEITQTTPEEEPDMLTYANNLSRSSRSLRARVPRASRGSPPVGKSPHPRIAPGRSPQTGAKIFSRPTVVASVWRALK